MHRLPSTMKELTRRQMFQVSTMGLGGAALSGMLGRESAREALTHFAPRAKSVIYLHMVGAPSHLDLFDASNP